MSSTGKLCKLAASCELPVSGRIMLILKSCDKRDFTDFLRIEAVQRDSIIPWVTSPDQKSRQVQRMHVWIQCCTYSVRLVRGILFKDNALWNYRTHSTHTGYLSMPWFRRCVQKRTDSIKNGTVQHWGGWGKGQKHTRQFPQGMP